MATYTYWLSTGVGRGWIAQQDCMNLPGPAAKLGLDAELFDTAKDFVGIDQ